MNQNFQSDFKLIPFCNKLTKPGWEYRIATWPEEIDKLAHKLFDNESTDSICYTRVTINDHRVQNCKITKETDGSVLMRPGDGAVYDVKRFNTKNKLTVINNNEIPHQMICIICCENKVSHILYDCNHFVLCGLCADKLYSDDPKCPICRKEIKIKPNKLFFA